jgi:hypothetical protein
MADFTHATWRKSSHSGGGSNSDCLEFAVDGQLIGVRDSKSRNGLMLVLPASAWSAFVDGAKAGDFTA